MKFKEHLRLEEARAQPRVSEASVAELGGDQVAPLCNTDTFNFTPMLRMRILRSDYYASLTHASVEDVMDHIQSLVDHAEPYQTDSPMEPSTLFCCVYRLLCRRLTREELRHFLFCERSPYIRAAGFFYIRFGWKCHEVWHAFQEHLFDPEEFLPQAGVRRLPMTIGSWLQMILVDEKYYGTMLPRISQTLKQDMAPTLRRADQLRKAYFTNAEFLHEFKRKGTLVDVWLRDHWTAGEIVALRDEHTNRFRCQVAVQGRSITVSLATVRLRQDTDSGESQRSPSRSFSRTRSRSRERSRARRRNRAQQHEGTNAVDEFLERERKKATVEPGFQCCKPFLPGHKKMLMGSLGKSHLNNQQDQPKRKPLKPLVTTAGADVEPVTASSAAGAENVDPEVVAERKRNLLDILQKYAPAGLARSSRVEYHDFPHATGGHKLDVGEAPDVLRLG